MATKNWTEERTAQLESMVDMGTEVSQATLEAAAEGLKDKDLEAEKIVIMDSLDLVKITEKLLNQLFFSLLFVPIIVTCLQSPRKNI